MPIQNALEELAKQLFIRGNDCAYPALAEVEIRQRILQGIRDRIHNPWKINQCGASLCGPAAFFYRLASDAPNLYIRIVGDLYLKGEAYIGQLKIRPSNQCRQIPALNTMHPVDWICLSALRDSENRLFTFPQVSNTFRGITWPWELARWFRLAGFSIVENCARVFPSYSAAALAQLNSFVDQGLQPILLVGVQAVGKRFPIPGVGNHWVVLNRPIEGNFQGADALRISVYSWGQERCDFNLQALNGDQWARYYFGYVLAHGLRVAE